MRAPALIFGTQRWSTADAEDAVADRRRILKSERTAEGGVVRFTASPQPETIWTFFAALSMDAIALPVPDGATTMLAHSYASAADEPSTEGTRLRLLTSGSTGTPKVVDLSVRQLTASAEASRARLGCGPDDVWLCCMPLHHIAGLSILTRTGSAGATVHLMPGFDAAAVSHAIDEDGITMMSLVPTMLRRLLDQRGDRPFPATLRVILLGGAPATEALLDRCRSIEAPVALTWGMTETASQIATREPGDLRCAPDAGLPLPGHRVFEENGRLGVEGPIAPGGRFLTADFGHLDTAGRVIVEGRGDALIISGGENVDPSHVERILRTHPSVDEAVVIGMPDHEWGERVCAILTGQQSTLHSAWLNTELEPHERPRQIMWLDALPVSPLGKVQQAELKALLAED